MLGALGVLALKGVVCAGEGLQNFSEVFSEVWLDWLPLQGCRTSVQWNWFPAMGITSSLNMPPESTSPTISSYPQRTMCWAASRSSGTCWRFMFYEPGKATSVSTGLWKEMGLTGYGFRAGVCLLLLVGSGCFAILLSHATRLLCRCFRTPASNSIRNWRSWTRRPSQCLRRFVREVCRAAHGAWKLESRLTTCSWHDAWTVLLAVLLPLVLSLAYFGLGYSALEELAWNWGTVLQCPQHVQSSVCRQSCTAAFMRWYRRFTVLGWAQAYQTAGQVCYMVERLGDSSSGEYIDMLHDDEASATTRPSDATASTAHPSGALPAELDPAYRHLSLEMSNAVCAALRKNGNCQQTFHVLSVPPFDWRHTRGFKFMAVPLTEALMRHPNLLMCSDGPRFPPPRADRLDDPEEATAAGEETEIPRAELEDVHMAGADHGTRMSSSTAPSTATASGSATPTTTGPQRRRRQPWPSKAAPPVPTPAKPPSSHSSADPPRQDGRVGRLLQAPVLCPLGNCRTVRPGEATRTDQMRASELVLPGKTSILFRVRTTLVCLLEPSPKSLPADVVKTSLLCRAPRYRCYCYGSLSLHAQRLARYSPTTFMSRWPVSLQCIFRLWLLYLNTCLLRSIEAPAYLMMILSAALFGLKLAHSDLHYVVLPPRSASCTSPATQALLVAIPASSVDCHVCSLPAKPGVRSHRPRLRPEVHSWSRPGPKSRSCSTRSAPLLWLMLFVLLLSHQLVPVAAADARVGSRTHRRDPGAQHHAPLQTVEAKSGDLRHSDSRHNFPPRVTPKKRALNRAIHRASQNEDQCTWYRGRRLHLRDLQAGGHASKETTEHGPPSVPYRESRSLPDRPSPRLRLVSWNCGGLTSTLYQEVLLWLHDEEQAGRSVDILCIVETSWREEFEFQTQPVAGSKSRWFAVHSGGKAKEGILCLIRSTLVPADCVRYRSLMDGRLLHVRLLLRTPLDILCTYQYAWNPQKSTLDPSNKVEQLVKQRARVWQQLSAWITQTPRRHGLVLLGDFNCPLVHDPPVCGQGLVPKAAHPHRDQADFQTLLHLANGRALNTWSAPGIAARTYLSPHADGTSLGTQIDYIIVRENLCDQAARCTGPIDAPFVPKSGCRHRPVSGTIPLPSLPRPKHTRPAKSVPARVQAVLQEPGKTQALRLHTDLLLQQAQLPLCDLDSVLSQGWQLAEQTGKLTKQAEDVSHRDEMEVSTLQLVRRLWLIRAHMQECSRRAASHGDSPSLTELWAGWRRVCLLQTTQRELRRRGRHRKIARVAKAVAADNVFQAARQFAPKTRRRMLQLRKADGSLQTHEEEFCDIRDYFLSLYSGPATHGDYLSAPISFSQDEVTRAFRRMAPGKAMPTHAAPAAVWKTLQDMLIPVVVRQLDLTFKPGPLCLPRSWCISELVLIPKPGKALTSVSQLRPICLLSPMAKILAAALAEKLTPFLVSYLQAIPQFAYTQGRSLPQGLERVCGQLAATRALLAAHSRTPYARPGTAISKQVAGGLVLSLDISRAYDAVGRDMLSCALQDAAVPLPLQEAIIAVHNQALIQVTHRDQQDFVPLRTGLRQGCSLSPALWALVTGWLLRNIPGVPLAEITKCNTSFADDLLFQWEIDSSRTLEMTYEKIKSILTYLSSQGLDVSFSKTVILLELRGAKAAHTLKRYVVQLPEGPHMRFLIHNRRVDVRIVTKHVYLGVVISFRKFEMDTIKHRLDIAKGQFARLKPILRCQAVPLKLRLHLWRACLPATLLHGIVATGYPEVGAKLVTTLMVQQIRHIAKSHSMWTHETNRDIMHRLGIVHPAQALERALRCQQRADCNLGDALHPPEVQLQWRHMLRAQFEQAVSSGYSSSVARLVPVDSIIHETFVCSECGVQFGTAAALKRHMFLQHMEDEQQQARRQAVKEQSLQSHMEHAKQGLPWCRHCDKRFNHWPNFHYHINGRCCPVLRAIYDQAQPGNTIMLLSEALIDNRDIVEMAGHANWLELAADPRVRQNLCHCVECHHRSIRPQYVKRHMLAKHPDLKPDIDKCQLFVQKSNVSPCKFCGETFQRRDAHLRSCVALFSGAFLYSRLGRALPTTPQAHHVTGAGQPGNEQQGAGAAEAGGSHTGTPATRDANPTGGRRIPLLQEPRGPGNGRGSTWSAPPGRQPGCRSTSQVAKAGIQRAGRPRKRPESAPGCQTIRQALGTSAGRPLEQVGPRRGLVVCGLPPGQHAEGAAAAEDEGRHADHPAPSPRQSAGHSSPRHGVHDVHSHGCEGKLGGAAVSDGAQMETGQRAGPDQARVPDAGGADPGALVNGRLEIRAADGHSGNQSQCDPARLAQRGCDAAPQHEVGQRGQETCPQPDGHLARPQEGTGHGEGAHCPLQGRPGGQQIPCHTPHHPGDRIVRASDDAGCGTSVPGGRQGLAAPQGPVWIGDMAGSGGEHAARSSAARTPGPEASLVDGEISLMTCIRSMRLGNEGNFCYCNALVRCILIVAAQTAAPASFFPKGLRSVFKGLLMSKKVVHIWKNPFWRMMMRDWARPEAQHDIAEFLQFIVWKFPGLEDRVSVLWASKSEELGSINCHDGGCSAPVLLRPPTQCLEGEGSVTMQQLVDLWHRQDRLHAALRCPETLILQASRFHFDVHTGVTTKLRYEIIPDSELLFPVFIEGMSVVHERFRLRSFALHIGSAPDRGHYKAIMLDSDDNTYLFDDGVAAAPCSASDYRAVGHDAYLFFYSAHRA